MTRILGGRLGPPVVCTEPHPQCAPGPRQTGTSREPLSLVHPRCVWPHVGFDDPDTSNRLKSIGFQLVFKDRRKDREILSVSGSRNGFICFVSLRM